MPLLLCISPIFLSASNLLRTSFSVSLSFSATLLYTSILLYSLSLFFSACPIAYTFVLSHSLYFILLSFLRFFFSFFHLSIRLFCFLVYIFIILSILPFDHACFPRPSSSLPLVPFNPDP